ncbi:hypothetical protein [Erythrobacter litoralis]|uniref:DUF1579 domain-containing protein n=1 Tax=Erythrobacter litoralis (strain HTCC2594) TaxID=314225 RepID=Q2NA00_ERYLH|nr:hypothetical protein [Erythrobacter litoralis]ABC63491.1 hypothetical protein ELI_06995 [Erythrobacter litoralis HTCC2594]
MPTSLLLAFALHAVTAQAATPPTLPASPPPGCQSEAHGQFDFWVGEWEVFPNGRDTKVADSRIERKHGGCAVLENWMPLRGAGGTSLNHVDPASGMWHQKWVGSAPGAVEFSGGLAEGSMVLTGNWPTPVAPHQLIRMTYTPNNDGSVRQHGESSTDHGLSWQTSFDLLYRPKATPE